MPFLRQKHSSDTMKRYSPVKLRENMEYYAEQFNTEHKGHTLQYYSDGHIQNFGVIERAVALDCGGYWTVAVYVKPKTVESLFPVKVFLDQIRSCSCIGGHTA